MKTKKEPLKPLLPPIELNRRNLILFIAALAWIAIGYILMSIGPWDNPLSLSVSPIVLLFGYFILIPMALLWGARRFGGDKKGV